MFFLKKNWFPENEEDTHFLWCWIMDSVPNKLTYSSNTPLCRYWTVNILIEPLLYWQLYTEKLFLEQLITNTDDFKLNTGHWTFYTDQKNIYFWTAKMYQEH